MLFVALIENVFDTMRNKTKNKLKSRATHSQCGRKGGKRCERDKVWIVEWNTETVLQNKTTTAAKSNQKNWRDVGVIWIFNEGYIIYHFKFLSIYFSIRRLCVLRVACALCVGDAHSIAQRRARACSRSLIYSNRNFARNKKKHTHSDRPARERMEYLKQFLCTDDIY